MKVRALLAALAMVFGLGLTSVATAPPAAAETGGYTYSNAADCSSQFGQYSWCINEDGKSGYTVQEQYSPFSYGYRNCTDFVAWRLDGLGVSAAKYRNLGNAKQWPGNVSGVTVNTMPAKGAAAVSTSGTFGHVAFVESVSGGNITVSEYNKAGTGAYGTRTGTPSALGFDKFIHFETFETWPDSGPTTSPPPPDSDNDGLADNVDECIEIPGVDYQQGCRQQMGTFRGDFNADGKEDVASFYMYPERGSAMSLFVWDGKGDGTLKEPRLAYYDASGWGADRVIPAGSGDFNKDGHPDIAIFYRYPNTVVRTIVWYGHADGSFNMAVATVDNQMEGANLIPVGAGDYNGDGNADIAALYRYPERGNALSAIVWYGKNDGTLSPGESKWYNASGWGGHLIVPIGSGNFFADGRTDFSVFYDYGGGVTRMLTWYGRADGTFYDPAVTFYAPSGWAGRHLVPAGVGDFDGDGKDDVASFYGYPERGNAVSLYLWKGNGDGTFQAPQLSWYTGSGWWWLNMIPMGVADLDGNGRPEIQAAYNYGGSVTRIFAWGIHTDGTFVDGLYGTPPIQYYATDMAAVNLRP